MFMTFTGKEDRVVFTFEREKESGMKDVYVKFADGTIAKNPVIGEALWRLEFHETGVRVRIVQAEQTKVRAKLIEKVPQIEFSQALKPCGAAAYPIGRSRPNYASVSCEVEIIGELDNKWLIEGNVIPLDDVDRGAVLYGFTLSKPVTQAQSVKVTPKPTSDTGPSSGK